MKSTGIIRKVDELGRVVLPIELRRNLDIEEKDALEKQYSELEEKLQDEQDRSEILKDRAAYMQTTRYIEEIARERLGLVYKEEIIFRPESQE